VKIDNSKKKAIIYPNKKDLDDNFKSYFRAGGRHQTVINGESVYEYLQTCTDAKILHDILYFKGKFFEFIGYELLSATSKNIVLGLTVPIFISKIPLDQLSSYLNMKELQDVSILHNIPIPNHAQKKTILENFHDHYCIHCELYASTLLKKKKKEKGLI
jgi:hypothetical protein